MIGFCLYSKFIPASVCYHVISDTNFQNISDLGRVGGEGGAILWKKNPLKNIASGAFQGDEIIYFKLGKNLWTLYLWNNVR